MITRRRVVHRLAGTVIGLGLAFAVLGWNPPIWLVVITVAFFQGLARSSRQEADLVRREQPVTHSGNDPLSPSVPNAEMVRCRRA